jgi:hypothetical protein
MMLSEDALDFIGKLLTAQTRHFQRFMNVVSMRRLTGADSL